MTSTGIRKLAYDIRGHKEGFYQIITWLGTSEDVCNLERQLRIDNHVLKFIVTTNDKDDISILNDTPFELSDNNPTKSEQPMWDLIFG